jgi:hypothetical protein
MIELMLQSTVADPNDFRLDPDPDQTFETSGPVPELDPDPDPDLTSAKPLISECGAT